jgi:hypothetical protein
VKPTFDASKSERPFKVYVKNIGWEGNKKYIYIIFLKFCILKCLFMVLRKFQAIVKFMNPVVSLTRKRIAKIMKEITMLLIQLNTKKKL